MKNEPSQHLQILGGGPAGVAAAFYAAREGASFDLFEAGECLGGNARTLTWGDFCFDTGAHRFHDKFPDVTADVLPLMGEELLLAKAPSQIVYGKNFVDFPLSPLNLAAALGPRRLVKATRDFLTARKKGAIAPTSLEEYAVCTYGRTIAQEFLLGYSEKLWGAPASRLLPTVSGQRLKGLSLKTLFVETVRGAARKTEHLDGQFYYPRRGIGQLIEALARSAGEQRLQRQSKITRLLHSRNTIHAIEINQRTMLPAGEIVSTLPLPIVASCLDPQPPETLLRAASSLRFRHVLLVTLFLKRERVTQNASLYFPDKTNPITRVSEPKNRSPHMSPAGHTSICAEIPCFIHDPLWLATDSQILKATLERLTAHGLIHPSDLIGHHIYRIPLAYPVLEIGSDQAVQAVLDYLNQFTNLHILGRNASFQYTHIHNLLAEAKSLISTLFAPEPAAPPHSKRRKAVQSK